MTNTLTISKPDPSWVETTAVVLSEVRRLGLVLPDECAYWCVDEYSRVFNGAGPNDFGKPLTWSFEWLGYSREESNVILRSIAGWLLRQMMPAFFGHDLRFHFAPPVSPDAAVAYRAWLKDQDQPYKHCLTPDQRLEIQHAQDAFYEANQQMRQDMETCIVDRWGTSTSIFTLGFGFWARGYLRGKALLAMKAVEGDTAFDGFLSCSVLNYEIAEGIASASLGEEADDVSHS